MQIRGLPLAGSWLLACCGAVPGCDTAFSSESLLPEDTVSLSGSEAAAPATSPDPLDADGIRIDRPRRTLPAAPQHACDAGYCGPWLHVTGVVSESSQGPIDVSLLNPGGLQVNYRTARLLPDVVAGPFPTRPWEAYLPLPREGFHHYQVTASRESYTTRVSLRDEQIPRVEASSQHPCSSSSCGLIHPSDAAFEELLLVTRDNPDLSGKLRLQDGEIAKVAHNDEYTQDVWHFGFGSSDAATTLPPEAQLVVGRTRDQIADLGPDTATQSMTPLHAATDAQAGNTAHWSVRLGSIAHESAYFVQSEIRHRPVTGSAVTTPSSRLYLQLADDVLLVPVIVVVWLNGTQAAPSRSVQRRQAFEAVRLFDFEDQSRDRFWVDVDSDSVERANAAPMEAPPDDIWSQCGIQFQVIGVVTAEQEIGRSCGRSALYRNFAEVVETDQGNITLHGMELVQRKLLNERDTTDRDLAALSNPIRDLDPIIYNLGIIGGCTFAGSAYAPQNLVEVDTDPYFGVSRSAITTAHELGHVLLGSSSHCEEMHGKTQADCRASGDLMVSFAQNERTIHDCDRARTKALQFSNRYRIYREALDGRPPVARQCCDFGGNLSLAPESLCESMHGTLTEASRCEPARVDAPLLPSHTGTVSR